MSKIVERLIEWIRTSAEPAQGLLIPMSGGSDSAVCFWLCSKAFPEKTIGVHAGHALRCKEWFEGVGRVEYTDTPGEYLEREEMRWARFLSMSLTRRYWLVGSRNRTEDQLGTYSLSSRVATFLPLVGIWKSTVMETCKEIGVPNEIIASSLRADPDCGRPGELAEIPFTLIELFLKVRMGGLSEDALTALSEAQVIYLDSIYRRNRFKESLPIEGFLE